jgi:hypothetical protein
MKFVTRNWLLLSGGLLVAGLSGQCAALSDGALPDATQVMERVVQRAGEVARAGEAGKYVFEKHSVSEELDSSGNATKTTEKTYEVIRIEGRPFSRLVKIQNRALTEEETKAQNRKEQEFREKMALQDPEHKRKDDWLDPRLIDRYDFKVESRDCLKGRSVLVLSFHPRANREAEKTVEDRVLNRLAGSLWVDEQEAEIAQLKVGLTEDLSLGLFGMIGSLKQFDLEIERERLADGDWVDQKQRVLLFGRKIFSPMRYRTLEESSNFKKP